MLIPDNT